MGDIRSEEKTSSMQSARERGENWLYLFTGRVERWITCCVAHFLPGQWRKFWSVTDHIITQMHWAILSCGAVYYAVQGGSNFWVCGWNPKDKCDHSSESYWEVYFTLVLFIMLHKVILAFETVDKSSSVRTFKLMRAIEYSLSVILFLTPFNVILTFDSADEILKRDIKWKLLSSTFLRSLHVNYAVQGGSNICVHGWNPKCDRCRETALVSSSMTPGRLAVPLAHSKSWPVSM